MPPQNPSQLPQSDLLRLWEYFHEKGDKVKERLWEIAVWHFTILTGVLGFIGKEFLQKPEFGQSSLDFSHPLVVVLLAGLGIFLSLYSLGFIRAYGNHVIWKWAIADQIRGMIPGLTEAVELKEKAAVHKDGSKVKAVAPEKKVVAHQDGAKDKAAEQKNNKPKDRRRRQWIPDLSDVRQLMLLTAIYLMIFIALAAIAGLQMT